MVRILIPGTKNNMILFSLSVLLIQKNPESEGVAAQLINRGSGKAVILVGASGAIIYKCKHLQVHGAQSLQRHQTADMEHRKRKWSDSDPRRPP